MDNPGWIAIVLKWFSENKRIKDSSGVRERERVFTLLSSPATLLYYFCVLFCFCVQEEEDLKKKEVIEKFTKFTEEVLS